MLWCEAAERLCPVRELGDGIVEWALTRLTEGLFVDGGAHVGLFCIPVLLERPDARCVAFEPNPVARHALGEMAQLNGVAERLTVHRYALHDYAGRVELRIPVIAMQAGLATLGAPKRFGEWHTHYVEAIQLDSLELAPQLLKLDLEGAELYALYGAAGTIMRHSPAIVTEAYAPNTAQFGYEPGEIGRFLEGLGYHCEPGREDLFCTT